MKQSVSRLGLFSIAVSGVIVGAVAWLGDKYGNADIRKRTHGASAGRFIQRFYF